MVKGAGSTITLSYTQWKQGKALAKLDVELAGSSSVSLGIHGLI